MRKKLITFGAAALLSLPALAGTAFAAGHDSNPTVGNCISDIFYGNEPNMANGAPGGPADQAPGSQAGNVLPSQSPGPFVTNPLTGEVTKGHSIGWYQQQGINIPQLCQAAF
jgi:hypothetical protein